MPQTVIVERVGLTVEALLFRAYGRRGNTSAMLTKALAANPGVAGLGVELPLKTSVTLPDLDTRAEPVARATVNLFGD